MLVTYLPFNANEFQEDMSFIEEYLMHVYHYNLFFDDPTLETWIKQHLKVFVIVKGKFNKTTNLAFFQYKRDFTTFKLIR